MRPLYWLVIIPAVLTGLCKALPSQGRDVPSNNWRRFLFTTGNTVYCTGACNNFCPLGHQRSQTGCFLCACVTPTSGPSITHASVNFSPSNFSTNAGHVGQLFENPCDPSVRHCPLQCANGYQTGSNGCQICACVESLPVITVPPYSTTHIARSTAITQPTNTTPITTIKITTKHSSRTTRSRQHSTVSITTQTTSTPSIRATTSQTSSLGTTKHQSGYFDPCIPTQTVCVKNCNNEYVLGPEGCQYCLCADRIPAYLRRTTTSAPALPTGLGKSNTSISSALSGTVSPTPSMEACIMAKVICNEKCTNGFISQPDDCLFCSCIQSGSVQSDVNTPTRLHKPCLYRRKTCGTTCIMGYIRGPRDCQFCSCRPNYKLSYLPTY